MTTQVATIEKAARRLPTRQIMALMVWGGAVWTTSEAIRVIAPELTGATLCLVAMAVQTIMTYLESDIWLGRFRLLSVLVLVVDVFVNAGGVWIWISRIDQTPLWDMLVQTLGAPEQLVPTTETIMSVGGGAVLAYAPEAIWNGERK